MARNTPSTAKKNTAHAVSIVDFSQSPYVLKKVRQARATLAKFPVPSEYKK